MRLIPAVAVLLLVASCGPAKHPAPTSASSPLPPLPRPAPDAYAVKPGDAEKFREDQDAALAPPDRPMQQQAIAAVASGNLYEAKRLLARLVIAYPEREILLDQYNAVVARIASLQSVAKASLEATPLLVLSPPPVKYTLSKAMATAPVPRLTKKTEKRNGITDTEQWFRANGHSPAFFVRPSTDVLFAPGSLVSTTVVSTFSRFVYTEYEPSAQFATESMPLAVPLAYGTMALTNVIDSAPYVVAIYARRVVAVFDAKSSVRGLFDFAAWAHPAASKKGTVVVGKATLTTKDVMVEAPITVATESITHDLQFALAREGTLYVEHTNNRFAKESQGLNAYVSAIDLATGELAWRSAPLVANGQDFTLVRGGLICGYGFTDEPDFVHVLDSATGAIRQKIPVRSGPDYFVLKDDQVRIRTYDTDYVFDAR